MGLHMFDQSNLYFVLNHLSRHVLAAGILTRFGWELANPWFGETSTHRSLVTDKRNYMASTYHWLILAPWFESSLFATSLFWQVAAPAWGKPGGILWQNCIFAGVDKRYVYTVSLSVMSCQKIGTLGRALCRKGRRTATLSAPSNIPAFACASLASSGLSLNGQKVCKSTASCDTEVNGSTGCQTAPASHAHQAGKKRGEDLLSRSGRAFSSTAPKVDSKTYLWARYNEMKRLVHGR